MTRILIADDDADLVEGLSWYLAAEGFDTESSADGPSALARIRAGGLDLAILDIMMPGMDGVEVCAAARAGSDLPIIMLSARDGELDKVRALSVGADDYVTKPFHASELVARVKALLRRSSGRHQDAPGFEWNGLRVYPDERQVTVNGSVVDLTAAEFNLLSALIRHPRMVFPRERLIEAIWGDDFYGEERLVDNHVYRLREKLSAAGLEDCPIVTVRGVGYAFRPND
ncbi:MAG: response regulator transcription factor [Armatimonadota bacterium]